MFDEKQRGVIRGAVPAWIIALAVFSFGMAGAPEVLIPNAPFPTTLAAAFSWTLVPAFCLLANIVVMANHRFYSPADIDGGGLTVATPVARIIQSTLQNTLEQAVLAALAYTAWAAVMPQGWQAVVPCNALLFVIGRGLFWRGYAGGAAGRALGFGLTFYPTALMLVVCLLRQAWLAVA